MARKTKTPSEVLSQVARAFAGVEEGIACEGTVLEKRTFKVNDRAFLFLSARDAILKLGPSLDQARALSAKDPEHYRAGKTAWVSIPLLDAKSLPTVRAWVSESYGVIAEDGAAKKKSKSKKR